MENSNKKTGAIIVGVIGFIASCIGIFTFLSGYELIREIFDNSSQPVYSSVTPFKNSPSASTQVTPTSFSTIDSDWYQIGLQEKDILSIISIKNVVYAVTRHDGILRSDDKGESWTGRNNGFDNLYIYDLKVAVGNPERAIARQGPYPGSIYFTSNGGKTWSLIEEGEGALDFGSRDGNLVFANRSIYGNHIQMGSSNDNLQSWNVYGDDSPIECDELFYILDSSIMYCTHARIFSMSNNKGTTWQLQSSVGDEYYIDTIGVSESAPMVVYAGTDRYGLWKSEDGGGYWTPMNYNLLQQGNSLTVSAIYVDKNDSDKVFIGTETDGVFFSKDGGQTWTMIGQLLPNVLSLSTSEDNKYLFAGTDGEGMWRINLPAP